MGRTQLQTADRSARLGRFLEEQRRVDPGAVFLLDGSDDQTLGVEVLPTGVPSLDVALGGGFARGRLVELYGPEQSGKSALSMTACAAVQRQGGNVGYIDAECAFNPTWASEAFGMELARTAVAQPTSGLAGLTMVRDMALSGAFDVIVIDSVAALPPPLPEDKLIGEALIGSHARMLSAGIAQLVGTISESKAVVIFINQLRNKIGAIGNPEHTPGGKALKYYSSQRISVRSGNKGRRLEHDGEPYGQTCDVTIEKNKVAPPYRKCTYDLHYHSGVQTAAALLDAAVAAKVVLRPNKQTYVDAETGERLGSGRDNLKALLAGDRELAKRLLVATYDTVGVTLEPELVEFILDSPATRTAEPAGECELEPAGTEDRFAA